MSRRRSLRAPRSTRARAALVGVAALALALCCTLVAVLGPHVGLSLPFMGACGGGDCARANGQTLTAYVVTGLRPTDRALLDPAFAAEPAARQITRLLYDGLVTLDANLKVELWGASAVDVSPDGRTYTFHLRPGQRFSDGAPVHASDYAWSLERLVSPCVGATTGGALLALQDAQTFAGEGCAGGKPSGKGATLIGDSIVADDGAGTLALTLAQPNGGFLATLAAALAYAVERGVVDAPRNEAGGTWPANLAHGATGQGGSGMFYLAAAEESGALTLQPNPHWWGRAARRGPHIGPLAIRLFGSGDAAYGTFRADPAAAYLAQIPDDKLPTAASDAEYRTGPALRTLGIALNWKAAPFDNPDARAAFCLAINRDRYAATVAGGLANPTWHVVPQGMPGYYRGLAGLDNAPTAGDAAAARKHWQAYLGALNLGQEPAPVTLSYATDALGQQALATYLQEAWSDELGITVALREVSAGAPVVGVEGKGTQAFPLVWGTDVPDPEYILSRTFASTGPGNVVKAAVPEADALLAEADSTSDPMHRGARLEMYNEAEQYLVSETAVCPIAQLRLSYEVRPWVRGLAPAADGLVPLDAWAVAVILPGKPQDGQTATATTTAGATPRG